MRVTIFCFWNFNNYFIPSRTPYPSVYFGVPKSIYIFLFGLLSKSVFLFCVNSVHPVYHCITLLKFKGMLQNSVFLPVALESITCHPHPSVFDVSRVLHAFRFDTIRNYRFILTAFLRAFPSFDRSFWKLGEGDFFSGHGQEQNYQRKKVEEFSCCPRHSDTLNLTMSSQQPGEQVVVSSFTDEVIVI